MSMLDKLLRFTLRVAAFSAVQDSLAINIGVMHSAGTVCNPAPAVKLPHLLFMQLVLSNLSCAYFWTSLLAEITGHQTGLQRHYVWRFILFAFWGKAASTLFWGV